MLIFYNLLYLMFLYKSLCCHSCCLALSCIWPFWDLGLSLTRLLCPWDFLGKSTAAGCHFLLQGIFLTQRWNTHLLHLLHWQVDSLPLSQVGSSQKPFILYKICFIQKAKFHKYVFQNSQMWSHFWWRLFHNFFCLPMVVI